MPAVSRPDLSERPGIARCQRVVRATPSEVFAAFTTGFERWFAQPGTLSLVPAVGRAFFFYNRDAWGRHPHYCRILALEPDRLVELTWVTGNGEAVGTEGAETVLRVELTADGEGTAIHLTHAGLPNEASRAAHEENWPLALDALDAGLQG